MNLLANKTLVLALCLLAVAGGYGAARLQHPSTADAVVQNATALDFPRPLPEIALVDHLGQPFAKENLLNHWSILFFGFTNCPDVCPTTLTVLRESHAQIVAGDSSVTPRIYMISVDPKRDTPEKLAAYVTYFHPEFTGITGTEAAIAALTQAVGVARNQMPMEDGQYTVDHTSALFFVDPAGRTAAISSSPHLPKVIANDFLAIARRQ